MGQEEGQGQEGTGARVVEAGPTGLVLSPYAGPQTLGLCAKRGWFCSHSFFRISRKDPVLGSVRP